MSQITEERRCCCKFACALSFNNDQTEKTKTQSTIKMISFKKKEIKLVAWSWFWALKKLTEVYISDRNRKQDVWCEIWI